MAKLQRFIKDINLSDRDIRIDDANLLNQVKNVFRLKAGDNIIISDGRGSAGTCKIKSFSKGGLEVTVLETVQDLTSKNQPALYCAVLKKENFEFVVQKAVECGIGKIVPIVTDRTIKLNLNLDRLEKIAKEAAEQSGRADVPEIYPPIKFEEAVRTVSQGEALGNSQGLALGINILFDISGEPVLNLLKRKPESVSAWIGPEGGWSLEEIDLAKNSGFKIASLGKTTLRGETAAIVASYLISN